MTSCNAEVIISSRLVAY